MTSLREKIEAKKRRSASFPLLVGDAAAAAAEVAVRRGVLDLHLQAVKQRTDAEGRPQSDEEQKRTIVLRGALKEAVDRQADTVVDVELQSLPPDLWDEVCAQAPVDEAGDFNYEDILAELLAESCVDESLKDAEWWREQLARPEFSRGDRYQIVNTITGLNLAVPQGGRGNG